MNNTNKIIFESGIPEDYNNLDLYYYENDKKLLISLEGETRYQNEYSYREMYLNKEELLRLKEFINQLDI